MGKAGGSDVAFSHETAMTRKRHFIYYHKNVVSYHTQ